MRSSEPDSSFFGLFCGGSGPDFRGAGSVHLLAMLWLWQTSSLLTFSSCAVMSLRTTLLPIGPAPGHNWSLIQKIPPTAQGAPDHRKQPHERLVRFVLCSG